MKDLSVSNIQILAILLIPMLYLNGCGRVYFPIELNTISRSDRSENQENPDVKIISMTNKSIIKANSDPYTRRVIEAGNLEKPAVLVSVKDALKIKLPTNNDPGAYLVGIGDIITITEITVDMQGKPTLLSRDLIVDEDGLINIIGLGRLKAVNLKLSELEDFIAQKYVDANIINNFNLAFKSFNSKKVFVAIEGVPIKTIPYVSTPMFLENLLANLNLTIIPGTDTKITVLRNKSEFVFSAEKLLKSSRLKYRIFPNDRIFIKPLNFRNETVLVVGETGAQRSIPINSIQRPTLSDTIFSGSVLNSITSDFSQIYVLRKKRTHFNAYHLDITNPTRVSLSSKFEMRPDDIVFVATQPLSLYSRTLSQILGSTGLTLQARDTIRAEVSN